VEVGEAIIESMLPLNVAATAPFKNVTSTEDAAMGVFAPITTTAVVPLKTEQEAAAVPELGVTPTLAEQANPGTKSVPVTVTVLPAEAKMGEMDVQAGKGIIESMLTSVAATAPFKNVTSTEDAAMGVLAPITTTAVVPLKTEQDAAAVPELGVTPTLAEQAYPETKSEPVTVIVLPT
jgi:hypothetical protein